MKTQKLYVKTRCRWGTNRLRTTGRIYPKPSDFIRIRGSYPDDVSWSSTRRDTTRCGQGENEASELRPRLVNGGDIVRLLVVSACVWVTFFLGTWAVLEIVRLLSE